MKQVHERVNIEEGCNLNRYPYSGKSTSSIYFSFHYEISRKENIELSQFNTCLVRCLFVPVNADAVHQFEHWNDIASFGGYCNDFVLIPNMYY